jgi:NitT/TauT family transport system substrate-binding protein
MKVPGRGRKPLALALAALALGITACSSGSSSSGGAAAAGSGGKPEQSTITIGVLSAADGVTVQIAKDKGFFQQQGLNVKVVTMANTNSTPLLLSHTIDFSVENYVSMFTQEKLNPSLNLKIVADNTQGVPNLFALLTGKNSKITSLAQLKGKKVGFPAPGFNFGSMAMDLLLAPYHMNSTSYTTVVVPFSAAGTAVDKGQVDAAFATEPFITASESSSGDHILQDLLAGPMAGFPVACWGTTGAFVKQNPNTVAAFQRAIGQAVKLAASNPGLVRTELPKFIPTMKPAIAKVITLPEFNTTLTLARMQRVASVEEQLGQLPKNFDVKSMFYPPAS